MEQKKDLRRSRLSILGIIAASVAFVVELTVVPLALPRIKHSFDLSIGELALVFNAYTVSVTVGVLLSGWFGNGRLSRSIFQMGLLLFIVGAVLGAISNNLSLLVVARVIQGTGGGLFSPLVPVLLTLAFPNKPGKILIVWGSIAGYIAATAPLIGSFAMDQFGWQCSFFSMAVIATLAFFASYRGSYPMGAKQLQPYNADDGVFGHLSILAILGYIFFTNGVVVLLFFSVPLSLVSDGHSATFISVLFSVVWLSFSVTSSFLRNAIDGKLLNPILLSAPIFMLSCVVVLSYSVSSSMLLVGAVLLGVGFANSNAPSTLIVLRSSPARLRTFSASIDIICARLGGFVSVLLLAELTHFGSSEIAILFCSGGLLCGVVSIHKVRSGDVL